MTKLFTVLQAENLDPGSDVHPHFVERQRRARAQVTKALREAKERGEIRGAVDETATANIVLAFMSGAQIQYFLDPPIDVVDLYERFAAMLVRDLSQRPPARRGRTRRRRAS